jgi:prophage regulatory protein
MRLLRTKQVVELTGLSRMTIYRLEKSGAFPARRQLGSNSVAWLEEDVSAWVGSRPMPRHPAAVADGAPPAYAPLPPRPRPDPQRRRAAARRSRRRPAVQVDLPLGGPTNE